jgi:4-aminobutyrate aminotransferase
MVGVEFASPPPPSSPTASSPVPSTESVSDSGPGAYNASSPANMASRVAARCIEKGMLILTTSVYQVIRFIPPLNVSKADLAKGSQIFAEAVREVVKEG